MQQTLEKEPETKKPQAVPAQAPAADFTLLCPDNAVFAQTEGHLLSLRTGGNDYPHVELYASFPHTDPGHYLSVREPGPDGKEIGLIEDIAAFGEKAQALLRHFLSIRYFEPQIRKIHGVRDEFGYSFWDVETDCGICRFVVRRGGKNVRALKSGKVVITDVDGNRFAIPDVGRLSEKELRQIEIYL